MEREEYIKSLEKMLLNASKAHERLKKQNGNLKCEVYKLKLINQKLKNKIEDINKLIMNK